MVWLSPIRRIRNVKRRIIRPKADFFWFPLDFIPPEQPVKVSWLRARIEQPPLSIAEFVHRLNLLAKDEGVEGIILEIQTELPFATTRSIMDHLARFREQGKELITFATRYSLPTYWLASIGSQVMVQHQGHLWISGVYSSQTFMGNFLKNYGFQLEKIAVSPYKSAFDEFARSDIAPEAKENREAMFRSLFDIITQDIATNRSLSKNRVQQAIEQSPLTPEQALERKLIDQKISAEELPRLLGETSKPITIRPFTIASKATLIPAKPSMKKVVAVIPVLGIIVDGKSREAPREIPIPFGGKQAGDHSIVPLIRKVLASPRVAAGVLYVDSRGGSATASESIRLALEEFASRKPLVAYFSNVAASGGYNIATPAQHIIAQPQTITGSIGVVSAKFNFQSFLKKQQIKTVEFKFGERADWMQPTKPLGDEERRVLMEAVFYSYEHFLSVVAKGRNLDKDYLRKNLAGGRVWTGVQAVERKLVDELGNLQKAIIKARELANLKSNSGTIVFRPSKRPIIPLNINASGFSEYAAFFQSLARIQIWMIELDALSNDFLSH